MEVVYSVLLKFRTIANLSVPPTQKRGARQDARSRQITTNYFRQPDIMSNPDFLSQNSPTEHSVRALWYLHQFHAKQPFGNGLAYEDLLHKCRLDYTLASLHRIDKLLDYIREKKRPNRDDFLRNPANQQFLFLLAFYLGEVRGRLARIAPIWQNYADFIAENPALESVFGYCFEYEFVAIFVRENDVYQHFPLVAILERLFCEYDEPEKSVYSSTITGDYQKWSPDDILPQTVQSLQIDVQAALKNTPAHWQHYWQILPPKWILGDDLMPQIQAVPQLYQKGRVVWAALVQANAKLFEHDNPVSCPAELIYDKSGRTPPEILHEWATELGQLKHTTPNDPELARYAKHITNERTRFSGSIPTSISRGMPVFGATLFVWRLHLPDAKLSLPIVPILIGEGDEVMILPAKLWQNTHFYQRWLDVGKRNMDNGTSQDILAAWANLSADEAEHFWQDYPELVVPQMEELPPFAQSIDDNPPTISSEDARFLKRCQNQAQQEYRRWYELFEIQTDDPELAEDLAKSRLPENLYQQLRTLNPAPFLDDLKREINVPRLSNTKPLPKVAAALAQNLSPLQTAKLVQFLHTHGTTSLSKVLQNERQVGEPERPSTINTTATLALALMYLTGKNVPQSIEEGIGWLNYAADLGDYRAVRWQAELVLHAPEITAKLFEQQFIKDALPLSVHLMKQGNISILTIKEAEKSYPKQRGTQLALARKCLEDAWQAGDTIAHTRLQTLIANGTLPQRDEKRFTHIQFWVQYYLQNKGIDISELGKEQSKRAKNATHAYRRKKQNEQNQDDELDDKPAWHQWVKWAAAIVVILGIKMCMADWRVIERQSTPVAEPTVSGSLKTQTTPTAKPATTAQTAAAESVGNNAVSLSDAVFILQQKLPKAAFTGYHEIESVYLDNQVVTVKIKDQNRGMMSIQAANSLYCREQLFDGLRAAKAVVIFDVQTGNDLRYEISDVHCQ